MRTYYVSGRREPNLLVTDYILIPSPFMNTGPSRGNVSSPFRQLCYAYTNPRLPLIARIKPGTNAVSIVLRIYTFQLLPRKEVLTLTFVFVEWDFTEQCPWWNNLTSFRQRYEWELHTKISVVYCSWQIISVIFIFHALNNSCATDYAVSQFIDVKSLTINVIYNKT